MAKKKAARHPAKMMTFLPAKPTHSGGTTRRHSRFVRVEPIPPEQLQAALDQLGKLFTDRGASRAEYERAVWEHAERLFGPRQTDEANSLAGRQGKFDGTYPDPPTHAGRTGDRVPNASAPV